MIRRMKRYPFLIIFFVVVLIYVLYNFLNEKNPNQINPNDTSHNNNENKPSSTVNVIPLQCHINELVYANIGLNSEINSIQCLYSNDSKVYVPFNFLKDYFEIYGEVKRISSDNSWFQWSHSYSKVYPHFKDKKYSFNGTFLQFGDFDVAKRKRVKCVTAKHGVPISTQWDKKGYYYSTQISQFGLSHWSKNILNKGLKNEIILEDGDDNQGDWLGETTLISSEKCIHFDHSSPISLILNKQKNRQESTKRPVLSFDLQFKEEVVISVLLKSSLKSFTIKYVPDDNYIRKKENTIFFGYGSEMMEGEWKHFTRDLLQDLFKGIGKNAYSSLTKKNQFISIYELTVEGVGCITNVSLSDQQYIDMFYHSANWLVKNQDSNGGWPNGVVFNKGQSKYKKAYELEPGWYSSMAQGHALSVLSRAYSHSKNQLYFQTALKALNLYNVTSQKGGFVANFLKQYIWFEEYPTNPPTFVLNGFMYSLIGLYDVVDLLETYKLKHIAQYKLALNFFEQGMESLKALLPLYDAGSATHYDLRHFTMKTEPKIARWDYHSTHINLLYILSSLDNDKFLEETANRWKSYMIGKKANHN